MVSLGGRARSEPLLRRTDSDAQDPQGSDGDFPNLKKKGKLDRLQLLLILLVQSTEPITATVIYPFVVQFVRETGVTGGYERKIGYYVGILESTLSITESATVYYWGRASDEYGRKPVIMTGQVLLLLATFGFGLSSTFWMMMVCRCIQGICNACTGVTRTTLAEITDSTTIAYALSTISVMWPLGCALGPVIGGVLARPAERWPQLFSAPLWTRKPYLLPCATAATYVLLLLGAISIWYKETNPAVLSASRAKLATIPGQDNEGIEPQPSSVGYGTLAACNTTPSASEPSKTARLLTKRTLIPIVNLGCQAFLKQCTVVLNPLIFSNSPEYGGFGMSPHDIGVLLGACGVATGVLQFTITSRLVARFGAKRAYMLVFGGVGCSLVCLIFMALLVPSHGFHFGEKVIFVIYLSSLSVLSMGFPCIYICILDAATETTLGRINGIAQMVSSFSRGVAPAFASSLYSVTLEKRYLGGTFVYWVLMCLFLVGMYVATMLPRKLYRS